MSSKRNHAIRSRKTHRYGLYGARRFLRGSRPFAERQALRALINGAKPEQLEAAEAFVNDGEAAA